MRRNTMFDRAIIVERALAGAPSLSDIIGPVGLVGVVGDAAREGLGNILARNHPEHLVSLSHLDPQGTRKD